MNFAFKIGGDLQWSGEPSHFKFRQVARQMLQAAASYKKVALLITDGKSNTGGSPISFARKMR